jgi:hypothetical protein
MMHDAGAGDVQVLRKDLVEFKSKALETGYEGKDAFRYLRVCMAEGLIDYRGKEEGGWGNDNEVVNPGQVGWQWKGLRDLAVETKGRPNAES